MSEKRFKSYALFKGKKTVYRDNEAYTNEEVADLLNEQQATIRKLHDLCGESDGENAKLRIENKKLREERQRLIYHLNKEPKR